MGGRLRVGGVERAVRLPVVIPAVFGDQAEAPAEADLDAAAVVGDAAAGQGGPGPGADERHDDGEGRVQGHVEREGDGLEDVIEAQADGHDFRYGVPPEGLDDPEAAAADRAGREIGLPAEDPGRRPLLRARSPGAERGGRNGQKAEDEAEEGDTARRCHGRLLPAVGPHLW
ncbi:MAG: hypothetical protein MZV63_66010 [Marinilabiliales bacterium]|nr:hypothetical protein [Marinilabiliales bacterium]